MVATSRAVLRDETARVDKVPVTLTELVVDPWPVTEKETAMLPTLLLLVVADEPARLRTEFPPTAI
jgi:hypothetical protein